MKIKPILTADCLLHKRFKTVNLGTQAWYDFFINRTDWSIYISENQSQDIMELFELAEELKFAYHKNMDIDIKDLSKAAYTKITYKLATTMYCATRGLVKLHDLRFNIIEIQAMIDAFECFVDIFPINATPTVNTMTKTVNNKRKRS